jgi:ATP-dependent Clp protease ATP-binding subunit ClpB
LLVEDLKKRLETMQISLELSNNAVELIAKESYDPVYGARPLKRFIQKNLETKIARQIIAEKSSKIKTIFIDAQNGELVTKTIFEDSDLIQQSA